MTEGVVLSCGFGNNEKGVGVGVLAISNTTIHIIVIGGDQSVVEAFGEFSGGLYDASSPGSADEEGRVRGEGVVSREEVETGLKHLLATEGCELVEAEIVGVTG